MTVNALATIPGAVAQRTIKFDEFLAGVAAKNNIPVGDISKGQTRALEAIFNGDSKILKSLNPNNADEFVGATRGVMINYPEPPSAYVKKGILDKVKDFFGKGVELVKSHPKAAAAIAAAAVAIGIGAKVAVDKAQEAKEAQTPQEQVPTTPGQGLYLAA